MKCYKSCERLLFPTTVGWILGLSISTTRPANPFVTNELRIANSFSQISYIIQTTREINQINPKFHKSESTLKL